MKLKKIIVSFAIIFILLQTIFGIICNANNESQIVILNEKKENINEIEGNSKKENLNIYSESAILIEATTGKILYEKDMYAKKYPASTTKILTAIIAIENCDLNEKAIASYNAVHSIKSGYSIANIQVGEEFTISELLDVMLLQSANEAANIIAEHISGSVDEFANLMNQKARKIGCLNSNFVNANGAHDDNHYSTAYDLAMIAKYCMQNEEFKTRVAKMECSLPTTDIFSEPRIFRNTNSLMTRNSKYYYEYCNGIKTGFTTPAKNCLISSSNKYGFELISVILHAETTEDGQSARYLDTINLFEYGYSNFKKDEIISEYKEKNYINENIKQDEIEQEEIVSRTHESVSRSEGISIQETTLETVAGTKKDYNSSEKDTSTLDWLKIIAGIGILFGLKYYFVDLKKIFETKTTISVVKDNEKDDIYDFKLN